PIGPSRRVTAHWDRIRASRFSRFLGPGVMRSAVLLLVMGVACLAALTVLAVVAQIGPGYTAQVEGIVAFGAYAIAIYIFTVGLGAYLRARSNSSLLARILLFTFLFAVYFGPWIIAAIAGLLTERGSAS